MKLYTSDLINRQILVVRGKKEGRWAGAVGKRHIGLSSAGSQGASNFFFFPNRLLPTTLPYQNIKCNLYRQMYSLIKSPDVIHRSFLLYHLSHLLIIHKVEERRCTRRRLPSSFSRKEEARPLCDAKAGPSKHLGFSKRETVAGRFRPWRYTLHTRKTKGTHAVRVILFYSSMDTKGVDCSERRRPPQRDTNKAFRLPSRAIALARRKRTATVSLFV
ncbi:hypothetical protein, partial [Aneurinibacillus migulanus]